MFTPSDGVGKNGVTKGKPGRKRLWEERKTAASTARGFRAEELNQRPLQKNDKQHPAGECIAACLSCRAPTRICFAIGAEALGFSSKVVQSF